MSAGCDREKGDTSQPNKDPATPPKAMTTAHIA